MTPKPTPVAYAKFKADGQIHVWTPSPETKERIESETPLTLLPLVTMDQMEAYAEARVRAALDSPEIRRLRAIQKAATEVMRWTEAKHRPPVREQIPAGETAAVRVHALADLYDALNSTPA